MSERKTALTPRNEAHRMAPDGDDGDRSTAPQSPFGMAEVRIGVIVLVIGLLVTFAIPLALI